MQLDLNFQQTRRLSLSGTVPLPTPFPTAENLSVEVGSVSRSKSGVKENATFVVVQEKIGLDKTVFHAALKSDVAAIFFPGEWVDGELGRVFRFAEQDGVHDLDQGEWFLGPDLHAGEISRRLGVDIAHRDSGARGIIFVLETKPVLTLGDEEIVRPAGEIQSTWSGCDPCCCCCNGCDPSCKR
jgi:hypothetical protein